ncbi:MAG: ArsC family reductase [Gammaproteobacteria bacterium]|nr:ArsC family reductase [Gammaproteobacteria bacterium]
MHTLYGIKNCDTVKKARKWLDSHEVEYQFHDFRVDGLSAEMIENWFSQVDWESLVNKRSTTWRQLDDAQKENIDQQSAAGLLLENPTLIKRPVLEIGNEVLVGFSEENYQTATTLQAHLNR